MSTVKIKTEPTTTAVDVQVKLEPSLSTADIKLEQHSSDIDTKVEFGSEVKVKFEDVEGDSDDDDTDDIDQFTITPKNQRRFKCEYIGCGRSFGSVDSLKTHQHEHRLQVETNIHGKTYTLSRPSLNDRWSCPVTECTLTAKTVKTASDHIRRVHDNTMKQKQHQSLPSQIHQRNLYFHDVDDFYVNGVRCGYHNTIGVFICYECRLVPECLLTHLQQKHGYDEKSIDNSVLPDSAVNANADPSINQYVSNLHLVAAISKPYQQHHPDIVQGWLCVMSDCGHCGYTSHNKCHHKKRFHQGEQITTVPALILGLNLSKRHASYFLIARIDQASGAVTTSGNRAIRHKLDYSHNGLNTQIENEDDIDQNETTNTSTQKQQLKCDYPNCRRYFISASQLSSHRREHKLEAVITVRDNAFTLSRQSLDDRWACPVPDCATTYKTVHSTHGHIQNVHYTLLKQKRAIIEDDDSNQQQQPIIKRKKFNIRYLKVDDFYIGDTRCGYHTSTGVFICHECRLVPECLLRHLQQKHGYNEKLIDNSVLPESAVNASADPNINQHTSNSHLTAAIRYPYQWRNSDIVQGWLCVASNCGYCCYTKQSKNSHHYMVHKGKQLSTAALVLRLLYGKTLTSGYLITRLDTTASNNEPSNSANQYNNEYDDDGDELVLSDYSDEDNIQ